MPKIKRSRRAEFLRCIAENIRICCKIRSTAEVAGAMGVSVTTVYNRIQSPDGITADELFRISEYMGVEVDDLTRPLVLLKRG